MEDASPEAFRKRFHEARRKRRAAVVIVTAAFVVIGWGLIRIFIPDFTDHPGRWTALLLVPVGWFGWSVGNRVGGEFETEVWKDLRDQQRLAGLTRQSLESIMEETLGEEEMYRRNREAAAPAEPAPPEPSPDSPPAPPAEAPPEPPAPDTTAGRKP